MIVTCKTYVRSLKNLVQNITSPSAILNNNVSQQVASSTAVRLQTSPLLRFSMCLDRKFSNVFKRLFVLAVLKQNAKWKQCVCNNWRGSFYSPDCIFFSKYLEIYREQSTCWNFTSVILRIRRDLGEQDGYNDIISSAYWGFAPCPRENGSFCPR